MLENPPLQEKALIERAVAWLEDRLPKGWGVAPTTRSDLLGANRIDAALDLKVPNGTSVTMVLEVKRTFEPRDVERLLGGIGRTLRAIAGNVPVLVISDWLSRRSQELLRDEGVNYLDMTGNALIRVDYPTIFISTQGAARDPSPQRREKPRVRGPKAGRLVRFLVDYRPPYGVGELASAAKVTPGYVSRLLESLDDEALVERSTRGRVEAVDVPGLLRRWAESYDVFESNQAFRYIAPGGAADLLSRVRDLRERVAVTGSFAAFRDAPVAAPSLLAIYADSPTHVADLLNVIPTDHGANAVLLAPFDDVVWNGTSTSADDGITYVARSQAAVDCLTGNGRMPAEGEALLNWMNLDETRWRQPALPEGGAQGRPTST